MEVPDLIDRCYPLSARSTSMTHGSLPCVATLVIDCMCLKSSLQWNVHRSRMDGLVDLGLGPRESDECDGEMATEALVFLAVGLLGHWKAPVAYFFANKLSAD